MKWKSSTVDLSTCRQAGLTPNEFCLLDVITKSQLHPLYSEAGWSTLTDGDLAETTGIRLKEVERLQKRFLKAGYVELNGPKVRTTALWHELAYLERRQSFQDATHEARPQLSLIQDEEKPHEAQDPVKEAFETFRKAFPGRKAGLDTEYQRFLKVCRRYGLKPVETAELLLPALEYQREANARLQAAGRFVPQWKHLSTWLNNRCWEEEIPEAAEKADPVATWQASGNAAYREFMAWFTRDPSLHHLAPTQEEYERYIEGQVDVEVVQLESRENRAYLLQRSIEQMASDGILERVKNKSLIAVVMNYLQSSYERNKLQAM